MVDDNETVLIAPCGLFCGICASYLAFQKNVHKEKNKISHCSGCRPRNKQCAYLKKNCPGLLENKIQFCYECEHYPCKRLQHLDQRYRVKYKHSPIDNLEEIKSNGAITFLANIKERYRCFQCGGIIGLHNQTCINCQQPELRVRTNKSNLPESSDLK